MKRLIASISLLVLAVIFCVWEHFALKTTTEYFSSEIYQIKELYNDNEIDAAIEKNNYLVESWKDKHAIFSTFIDHEPLKEIETSLEAMKVNLENDEFGDFSVELQKTISRLEDLNSTEMPLLGNIL